MACTNLHGRNARDLQTSGLYADETCGREELEKIRLGLAARNEGRNSVSPSVPPILTCGKKKKKAFLLHLHRAPETLSLGNHGL